MVCHFLDRIMEVFANFALEFGIFTRQIWEEWKWYVSFGWHNVSLYKLCFRVWLLYIIDVGRMEMVCNFLDSIMELFINCAFDFSVSFFEWYNGSIYKL